MKQNAIIVPSSLSENLLIYSWVFAAMILCLSHESVILSFLSVPLLTKIKHLSDLDVAVQKGDCNCISLDSTGIVKHLRNTEQEHLRVIADDISKNDFKFLSLLNKFFHFDRTTELAFLTQTLRTLLWESFSSRKTDFIK